MGVGNNNFNLQRVHGAVKHALSDLPGGLLGLKGSILALKVMALSLMAITISNARLDVFSWQVKTHKPTCFMAFSKSFLAGLTCTRLLT